MTEICRAALERLRKAIRGGMTEKDSTEYRTKHPVIGLSQLDVDSSIVVFEALDEHLPDDDESVTVEWLESIGAAQERGSHDIGSEWILGGRLSFFFWKDGTRHHELCGGGCFVGDTRGDVRLIARGLGIQFQEGDA